MANPSRLIICRHAQPTEPAWRLQCWAEFEAKDPLLKYLHPFLCGLFSFLSRRYPKMSLHLRAPIEVENLLPYNIQYRIFDKELDQNWSSYLRQGGLMPVHCVELAHLVLLNITIQDTSMSDIDWISPSDVHVGFKPSEWVIINPGTSEDYETEKHLILKDPGERKLDLRLNYM